MSNMDIETKDTVTNNTGDAASVADQDKNPDTPQWQGLRRVPDKLPMIALLILVVEVRAVLPVADCNLLTFVSAWRKIYLFWIVRPDAKLHQVSTADKTRTLRISDANKYSNPYDPESDLPGALGKGQAVATALGNFFKFWAYASTVIGAIIAGNIYLYQEIGQQTDIPRPISRQVQGYPVCMRCLHRRPHHSRLNINSCRLHEWRWSWWLDRRHGHYWTWYRRHQGQCHTSLRGTVHQFPSRVEDAQVWRGGDC